MQTKRTMETRIGRVSALFLCHIGPGMADPPKPDIFLQ
jgi:hypothetical protein